MRINEILTESADPNAGYWYHVSHREFDVFDLKAKRENRGTNYEGVYMNRDIEDIKNYIKGSGFLYKVSVNVAKEWVERESDITEEMVKVYSDLLLQHTNYRENWIENAIIPSFLERKRFEDVEGWIKTAVVVAGGYDYWMDGRDLVVFDPNKVKIEARKEFTPTEDKPVEKRPANEPETYYKPSSLKDLVAHGRENGNFLSQKSVDYILRSSGVEERHYGDVYKKLDDMGFYII